LSPEETPADSRVSFGYPFNDRMRSVRSVKKMIYPAIIPGYSFSLVTIHELTSDFLKTNFVVFSVKKIGDVLDFFK
jgi:hypothetical protein